MKKYNKTLFIIFFVLFVLIIFSYFLPILSYQEAKRIVIVQETYYGNFFVPKYNGNPYFTKPPLYTWFSLPFYAIGQALSFEVFFLRLISFLSYVLTGFMIYHLQKKDGFLSLLTFLILLTSFRFLSFIYRIDIEPLFIFLVTLSVYFLLKFKDTSKTIYIYLFYLFFSSAFLVRGPLHFFLLPSFLLFAFIFKDKDIFKVLFCFKGWLIFIICVFPWYIFGYLKFGYQNFQEFYVDILERLTSKKDPFYLYFEAFFLNFTPWILLFLIKIHKIFKFSISSQTWFYFFIFSIPLILMSFTGEKFDKYLLFLYPFFALFMSNILSKIYSKRFLLNLGIVLFILNSLAVLLIQFKSFEDLKYKIELIKAKLPIKEKVVFYKNENPLFLFYFKKPVPVTQEEKELLKYFEKGYSFFTLEEKKELVPSLVLPDPYKKDRIWYFYKSTF